MQSAQSSSTRNSAAQCIAAFVVDVRPHSFRAALHCTPHSTAQYSTALHNSAHLGHSTVQHSTIQYSTVLYYVVLSCIVLGCTVLRCAVLCRIMLRSHVQHSTAQVQYSTVQHSTTQHSTAQYSTSPCCTASQHIVVRRIASAAPTCAPLCCAVFFRSEAHTERIISAERRATHPNTTHCQ